MSVRGVRVLIGVTLALACAVGVSPGASPAGAAVASVTVVAGPTGTGGLHSLTGPCLDVLVVGARGSGQTARQHHGFGPVVGPAVDSYVAALHSRRVGEYALSLWSAPVAAIARQSVRTYLGSIPAGADRLTSLLTARSRTCPSEHYVLAGYSQGAAMVHRAYWRLRTVIADARWDGLLMIGDPDRFPGQTSRMRGTAGTTGKGIAWFDVDASATSRPRSAAFPAGVAGRAYEVCDSRDIVCDITRGTRFAIRHGVAVAAGDRVAEGVRIHRTHYLTSGRAGARVALAARAVATHTMSVPARPAMTVAAPSTQLTLGHPFSVPLAATGGVAPYTFSSSEVPAGLVLSPTGGVWGSVDGPRSFPVSVEDARGQTIHANVTVGGIAGPAPVAWSQVSMGLQHTCAVRADGQLWCWGKDVSGETGSPTVPADEIVPPTRVGTDSDWASVSSGFTHTCAIRTDQSLWCWGSNFFGESGRLPGAGDPTSSTVPVRVSAASSWLSVATGEYYTCGVSDAHALWCWGINGRGELGASTAEDRSNPVQVGTTTDWSAVSANTSTTCGVKVDGSVWCWGENVGGSTGVQPGSSEPGWTLNQVGSGASWSSVATGVGYTCGTHVDGSLWCWGDNGVGQLGSSVNVGTHVANPAPVRAGADADWTWVTAGLSNTCAGRQDGSLWCWGSNFEGELGQPVGSDPYAAHPTPVQIGPGIGWQTASTTGSAGTCAIDSRGALWCWGWNAHGELGVTTNVGTDVPNPDPQPVGE